MASRFLKRGKEKKLQGLQESVVSMVTRGVMIRRRINDLFDNHRILEGVLPLAP